MLRSIFKSAASAHGTLKRQDVSSVPRILPVAEGAQCFWVHDGSVLKDFRELAAALASMPIETFNHHVNSEKNDFASWIEDVFGDNVLARTVRRLRTRQSIAKAVSEHVDAHA